MIEDGVPEALEIDVEEDSKAERQAEKEEDNRAAGALLTALSIGNSAGAVKRSDEILLKNAKIFTIISPFIEI